MAVFTEHRAATLAIAPRLLATLVAVAGVGLLASGATPSDPEAFMWLAAWAPIELIGVAHFISSLLGVVLLVLAFGLSRRLDAAWVGTLVVLAIEAVLAIFKGFNWIETLILLALMAMMAPLRGAFPRRSLLASLELSLTWWLSVMAAIAGVGLVGWWSFQNLDLTDLSVVKLMADGDAERAIRSSAGAAILLLALGIWRLFATPATPPVVGETDPDLPRITAILGQAEVVEPFSNLALLGDKRFLFSPSGETFLMFGVRGRSWVALGGPVGRREERLELLWRFRGLADAHAARLGLYGLNAEDLPDIVELGFAIQKIGENAVVPIESFSLEGRKMGNLRRSWRKAGECGAEFEVLEPGSSRVCWQELSEVSDAWLDAHPGGEKSFTLGGFDPLYLSHFPLAVVRVEGRITAFASLWPAPGTSVFSIDLMRYGPDAPKDVMDFLFVELLNWGGENGYEAFDFGMAPLAGLEDRPLAPTLSRVGNLFYERGESFYNFRGVRRFKDKYDPVWQPRYAAAPHRWSIPIIMADVGLLTAGGVSGLRRRK